MNVGDRGKPVVYADVTKLAEDLAEISDKTPEEITRNIFDSLGRDIVAHAKSMAPYRTGKLRDSINYQIDGNALVVDADAEHAKFMEFGTGTRGEFKGSMYTIVPRVGKVLAFEVDGRKVFTRKVNHPGVAPRPFMRPAAGEVMGRMADKLAEQGAMWIMKGPDHVQAPGAH